MICNCMDLYIKLCGLLVFGNEMGVCNDYHNFVAATLTNNMDVAGGD